MSFDFRSLKPARTRWLVTRVRYAGRGRAVFANPPGEVEGSAVVTFARSGGAKVSITPDQVEPNRLPLHNGRSAGEYRRFGMHNPCVSVEVRTDGGAFSSTTDRNFLDGSFRAEVGQVLTIRPLRSEFVADDHATAAFWAVPLTNFVTDDWAVHRGDQELNRHPLRLFTTPQVPLVLTGEGRDRAELVANSRNQLLTFTDGEGVGFIEPLPGYGRRVERLRARASRIEFTAVAVGPARGQRVAWDDDASLFPIDMLALLNLATGSGVGAPWVEFRDAAGRLVRRCHIPFGASGRCPPRPAVACVRRNAIGHLLDRGIACGELGKPFLRVVLHQARAAADRGTQEAQFLTLCRAFETLGEHQGMRNHDLSAMLTEAQRQLIMEVVRTAQQSIRDIGHGETDPRRQDALRMISSRVGSAAQKEKDFGVKVCDLAARYGLHDAAVLDPFLSAHPLCGSHTWAAVLSQFRGAVTHEAYFHIGGRHDLWEIQRVKDHLHDLLLRIIWKIVGYGGPYRTPIPPVRELPNADWVTPNTTARELGFE